jgi:hypothetical protein
MRALDLKRVAVDLLGALETCEKVLRHTGEVIPRTRYSGAPEPSQNVVKVLAGHAAI